MDRVAQTPKETLRSIPRSQSLQAQAYQALRSAILSGELAPGDRLIETQLAKQLHVSRTPIREALKQLQQEELLSIDDAGTLRVATFSIQDAIQLYDCRLALEQLSITGACESATGEQLEMLNTIVTQAEQTHLNSSHVQLLDLDYQFHRLIAKSSGNLWLMSLLDQVFDKMALLRIQTLRHNPKVLEIRQEHRQIYQAIVDRNVDGAIAMMVKHLSASRDRVMHELKQLQLEQSSD